MGYERPPQRNRKDEIIGSAAPPVVGRREDGENNDPS
jgi:hypothetical protein